MRVPARRGRAAGGASSESWGDDHSDSEWTDINVIVHGRTPDLDDYDGEARAWKQSYVQAEDGYSVGVSACRALESVVDPDDVPDVVDEVERERRRSPRPGQRPTRPGGKLGGGPPRTNVGNRTRVPDEIVAWHWTLEDADGEVVGRARRRARMGPDACGAGFTVPETGRYRVRLRLELEDGEQTASESFEITDRLLVSVGDSYAAGQGNPDEPQTTHLLGESVDAVWLEPGAYRSLQSGPAFAADALEHHGDGDVVTFVTVATSGAKIDRGLLSAQHDWQRRDGEEDGQLAEVERTVGDRTIDALVLSIGGNDVGFADGVKDLLYRFWRSRETTVEETEVALEQLVEDYEEAGRRRRAKYDRLADRIDALDVEEVYVTEYPTAQFDVAPDGTVGGGCGVLDLSWLEYFVQPELRFLAQQVIPEITEADARAMKRIGRLLNDAVREAAGRHGWTYVGGVAAGFQGHGYCTDDRYFRTALDSLEEQGDGLGMLHPNQKGHRVYADQIADALRSRFRRRSRRDAVVRDHRERGGERGDARGHGGGASGRDSDASRGGSGASDRGGGRTRQPAPGGGRQTGGDDRERGRRMR